MNTSSDRLAVVGLTHLPLNPSAGKTFVVVVELNREVINAEVPVAVLLEKQRIVPAGGGFPETRPTGLNYFEPGFEPAPIKIESGTKYGVSLPMVVKKHATADPGQVPVSFPEKLLITAFINDLRDGFRSDLIYIEARTVERPKN